VEVDGKKVAEGVRGEEETLELAGLKAGKHRVRVVAKGAHTYFDLRPDRVAEKSSQPLPVTSEIEFTYSPASQ
jgi:hypothetical protein